MMMKRPARTKSILAQSAVELAVFGSVLLFVVGLIFRTGLSASLGQNQDLRVLRAAMRLSLAASSRATAQIPHYDASIDGPNSRSTASVTLVEDRLSVDIGDKFGTRDRIPVGSGASATYSSYLFYPLDWGENRNLPVADVIVNGLHFKFRSAAFSSKTTLPPDIPFCDDPGGLRAGTVNSYGHTSCWLDYSHSGDPAAPGPGDCPIPNLLAEGAAPDGCAVFYKKVYNYAASEEWDTTCDDCFDLNLDGTVDVDGTAGSGACDPLDPNLSERDCFNWQWKKVYGVQKSRYPGFNGIRLSEDNPLNTYVDLDNDFKEEQIKSTRKDSYGRIILARVIDYQDGDMSGGWDDRDTDLFGERELGLDSNVYMYSKTDDGTVYRVEEGQLVSLNTDQYVRTTNIQDHADFVERRFQLANDTGRFCPAVGAPEFPVEVCGDCYSVANVERTCFDEDTNVLFIRSRISDQRQRRWLTPNP